MTFRRLLVLKSFWPPNGEFFVHGLLKTGFYTLHMSVLWILWQFAFFPLEDLCKSGIFRTFRFSIFEHHGNIIHMQSHASCSRFYPLADIFFASHCRTGPCSSCASCQLDSGRVDSAQLPLRVLLETGTYRNTF